METHCANAPQRRGRFAPSPTADLHLGNLRTALLAWLQARSRGAEFLLRIEDLDRGRVRDGLAERQLEDLRAIGLDWDGDPVRQCDRIELYEAALERFHNLGLVYRCFCSRRDISEAASAAHGDHPEGLYPGTCTLLSQTASQQRADAGEEFALRLRCGQRVHTITDTRHGPISRPLDDIVLVRRDGAFAYNLAVVVDDGDQVIGEVVRGDDLLASTTDQAHLFALLSLPEPIWTHVPLILGPGGGRLAKRDGAVTMSDLAQKGVSREAIQRWLLASLGLEPPTQGGLDRLADGFDLTAVPADPVIFEPDQAVYGAFSSS